MYFIELNYRNSALVGRHFDHALRQDENDKFSGVNFWAVMNESRIFEFIAVC